jgi:hypothetical protein
MPGGGIGIILVPVRWDFSSLLLSYMHEGPESAHGPSAQESATHSFNTHGSAFSSAPLVYTRFPKTAGLFVFAGHYDSDRAGAFRFLLAGWVCGRV